MRVCHDIAVLGHEGELGEAARCLLLRARGAALHEPDERQHAALRGDLDGHLGISACEAYKNDRRELGCHVAFRGEHADQRLDRSRVGDQGAVLLLRRHMP